MKLKVKRFNPWFIPAIILFCGLGLSLAFRFLPQAFAAETDYVPSSGPYFVTVYDNGSKTIVKTSVPTVGELLDRLGLTYSDYDVIEPGLDSPINSDNFFINILRARPVLLKVDGVTKYAMTARRDPRGIFEAASVTVYDGDEIRALSGGNLLEVGLSEAYELTRGGGNRITITEEMPFTEQTVNDYRIPEGSSELRQLGSTGSVTRVYEVRYLDGAEVSRAVVSETIDKNPTPRIVAIGRKKDLPPEWETCASYAREAGVSEEDLYSALTLIYRESGCRVHAKNASSGAYGIPQSLPGEKMAAAGDDWQDNPVTQIRWMVTYVNSRYGGWSGALNFWDSHKWY